MKYGKGEDVNETTMKLIHWIWSEPGLANFLRGVAKGDPDSDEFEYGDTQLGMWLSDLLDGSAVADAHLSRLTVNLHAARELARELSNRDDPFEWLSEMDPERIRNALLGHEGGGEPVYVHATVEGFHPRNRFRVHNESTVYEPGWTSASGAWGLVEEDRQLCPEPIGAPCSCTVVQREKKR